MGIRAIGYLDIRLEGQLDQPGIWRYLRVWRYLGVWRMEIPGGMETGMSQREGSRGGGGIRPLRFWPRPYCAPPPSDFWH